MRAYALTALLIGSICLRTKKAEGSSPPKRTRKGLFRWKQALFVANFPLVTGQKAESRRFREVHGNRDVLQETGFARLGSLFLFSRYQE